MSEKTEQPTPKKLRDARNKGQVASSKDLVSGVIMITLFSFLWISSDFYYHQFKELILLPTLFIGPGFDFGYGLQEVLNGILIIMIKMILPPLGLVVIVAIAAHMFQFGLLLAFESLKPDLNKLNPLEGIKKIFAMKNLIELLKSVLKIAFLTILLYYVIRNNLADLLKTPECGLRCVPLVLGAVMKDLVVNTAFALIVIAGADFAFQKFQFIKQLKMSKDEIKQEYKEMEGDPHIKSKRKHLHQEMLSQNMTNSVKKSTVVVTNPTRIAIALEYREGETPLPIVRAKGQNLIAKRIIEIAQQEGIPIMENVPLARALHEQASVDQYIPSDLIQAVAEVLRWVAQLQNQR
ncbi:MAG: Flagellar biosynthetic protein FlhB [Pseudomonadota bacterium]|nr:Flagellar biosynthetic protein FlhB [Pseudomonadota bacterium]